VTHGLTGGGSQVPAGLRAAVEDLGYGVYGVDLFERGLGRRSSAYVVDGGGPVALVETGSAPSVPSLVHGLAALGMDPRRVSLVVVTHVHLDHAGALGTLMRLWPWAKAVVHPAGAAHLMDPSRLEASARAVYGAAYDALFGVVEPVPAAQLLAAEDREHLAVGDRELVVLHTPGHAAHHLAVEDPASQGLFTGDGAGVRYARLTPWGIDLVLPTTSPPRFDPEAMAASLRRLARREPRRLYYTHFGMAEDGVARLEAAAQEALAWGDLALEAWAAMPAAVQADPVESLYVMRQAVRRRMELRLREAGASELAPAWQAGDLGWDLELNAQGLLAYARYRSRQTQQGAPLPPGGSGAPRRSAAPGTGR
jgi:glyoxylase-like metal-dependent hydrolase (beta-lactamase superfamily II)